MGKRSRRKHRQKKRQEALLQQMEPRTQSTAVITTTPVTTTAPPTSYRVCHRGPKEVMVIGNIHVWAGAYREVRGDYDWDIILRLSDGDFDLTKETQMFNARARELFPSDLNVAKHDPAIIDLSWPDFYNPRLIENDWWLKFNAHLKTLPPGIMLVHCFGGHGRTGTALSILAALNGYHKTHESGCPVLFIRNKYCDDAVESHEQIKYVTEVTQVPVKASMSRGFGGYGQYGMGFTGGHSHHHPSTTTQGYVHQLSEHKTYDPYDPMNPYGSVDQEPQMEPGSAYTIRVSELKGNIEARWTDDNKDYIFADDTVYQVVHDYRDGDDYLLEIDWSTGSYSGVSQHRMRTGGV